MSDARERWKTEHRRRRVRARWLDPLKNVVSYVLIAAALVCLVLAPLVDVMFFGGFLVALVAGLLLRGVTFGEMFSAGGVDPGYTGDGGGGGDGGSN